ncbi:hypothetical protein PF006_g14563 [Phytophthora fragariae]|uniref:Abnormal spindle-like microcephaly-associated protein ASH domain-containing protein n=1 Tax=Phytophthora fragariae TaxID=53985 RepID=A0A6A3TFU3_9STRA|nr:hypothetical protein PF006_g14563 [Phytophthora fragariae]
MLNCRALLPDVKVVARGKKVDFGTISVGVERETRVTLSNLGMHTRAVFDASVDPPSMSTTIGLQCRRLSSSERRDNSTKRQLPVSASVLVPDVFLAPAEAIDFGEVVLGVSVPRVMSLENHSSILACLLLDLGSSTFSEEFAIATPPRQIAHLEDASNIFQFVLTNDGEQPIRWQIDTVRLCQGNLVTFAAGAAAAAAAVSSGAALAKRIASANPTSNATSVVFHVAPDHGELAPGEEVAIRVSFLPLDAVEYAEDELPLVVDGEPYVNLSLRGEGIHPHLSFSTNRVVLPSVPLEVTATAHFHVHATGYDHLELTCRVPLDTTRAPLTVLFPRGKTLSMACPSLPVELRFASNTSVAFNARLGFFDADGNSFALSVADCAENCLLTNYNFIQKQGLAPKLMDDGSSSSPRHSHQRK